LGLVDHASVAGHRHEVTLDHRAEWHHAAAPLVLAFAAGPLPDEVERGILADAEREHGVLAVRKVVADEGLPVDVDPDALHAHPAAVANHGLVRRPLLEDVGVVFPAVPADE